MQQIFGKYWFTTYFDTFHYTNQKVIFVNISSDLIIRVFKHREAVKHPVEDPSFLNSNFCLRAHSFHWQEILSVVFFEMISLFHFFKIKFLPNTQVYITIVCQSCFQMKMAFSASKELI